MYNLKHYSLLSLYYANTLVKYSLLVVVKPVSAVFATLESILAEWEPSKPLHKSKEIDYDDPDNYGI